MITTVIFDLDDTLFEEIDFCRSGFWAVARYLITLSDTHSPETIFDAIWKCSITGDRGSTFDRALGELGIPSEPPLIHKMVELYRTHQPTLTLPADSRHILEELKDRYALGLLTDGFLPTQRLKVQALGIERYFQAILYTEELGREHWKPSPLGFQRLLETLGAHPEQAVYVADNETKDFIAPNRLGLLTVQLLRPQGLYRQPSALPEAAPKHRIDKLGRLAKLLAAF